MLRNKTKTFISGKTQGLESKTILYFITLLLGSLLFASSCGSGTGTQQACEGDNTIDPNNNCLPYTPANIEVKEIDDDNRILDWNDLNGIHSFRVQTYCSDNSIPSKDVAWPKDEDSEEISPSTSEMPIDLSQIKDKQCHFRVRGCGQNGCGPWSISVSTTIGLPAPYVASPSSDGTSLSGDVASLSSDVPSGASSGGAHNIIWPSVTGAGAYQLERSTDGGSNWRTIDNNGSTSPHAESDLSVGTYDYRVRACLSTSFNNNDCSGWTNTLRIQVQALAAPLLPSSLTIVTTNGYTLNWDDVTGATSYEIEETVASDGNKAKYTVNCNGACTSTHSERAYTGKAYKETYTYKVRACSGALCGDWSTTFASFEVRTSLSSDVPSGTSSAGAYNIIWPSVTGAGAYQLERSADGGSNWITLDNNGSTSPYTENNLGVGTYDYRVRTCLSTTFSNNNCSGWTSTLRIQVQALVAPSLTSSSTVVTTNGYTLNWDDVTGATSYEIEETVASDGNKAKYTVNCNGACTSTHSKRAYTGKAYGETYTYKVRTCDGNLCGALSSTFASFTILLDVASLSSDVPSGTSSAGAYNIIWPSVTGAGVYQLERSIDGGSNWATLDNSGSTSPYTENNLGVGTYDYRVRACLSTSFSNNCSGWTSALRIQVQALAAPSLNSNPTVVTTNSYTLNWDDVTGATSYEIEETVASDGSKAKYTVNCNGACTSTHSERAYTGKAYKETYTYKIRTCDGALCGDWSTTFASFEVRTSLSSDVPSGTSSDGTYNIIWPSVTGAGVYQLEKSTDGGSNWTTLDNNGSTSPYTESNLGVGTYDYRVRACVSTSFNNNNCSGWTSTLRIQVQALAAPILPSSPTIVTTNGYTLNWDDVTGATSYEIEETVASDGSKAQYTVNCNGACTSTHSERAYTGKAYEETYTYKVRTCNGALCGDWSTAFASFTVNLLDIANFSLSTSSLDDGSKADYEISWDSVTGAKQYVLQESTDGGINWDTVLLNSGTATNHSFTNKEGSHPHKTYQYRVKACAEIGSRCQVNYAPQISHNVTLPPPSGLATSAPASMSTSGSYSLSWEPKDSAGQYKLEESYNSANIGQTWSWLTAPSRAMLSLSTSTNTSFSVTGNLGHTQYQYQVRSCDSTGSICGSPSALIDTEVLLPVLTGLQSDKSISYGSFNLSWDPPNSATNVPSTPYYFIEENADDAGWIDAEHNLTSPSLALSDKAVATYKYRVRLCSERGCGPVTANNEEVTVNVRNLRVPENFAKSGNANTYYALPSNPLNFTWSNVTGATIYQIQWKENSVSTWPNPSTNDNAKLSSSSDNVIWTSNTNTNYDFRIRSCTDNTCSDVSLWSTTILSNIAIYDLSPPTTLSNDQANEADKTYSLNWSQIDGADSYILEESADESSAWTPKYQGSSTTSTPITQSQAGNYSYQVKACADHDSDTNTPSLCGTWYTSSTPINLVLADSGTGTSADPYIISTYPQLKIIKYDLGASYKLANNIEASPSHSEGASDCTPYDPTNFDPKNPPANLCTGWEPISVDSNNPFTGNFYGNNKEIKNLFSYGGGGHSKISGFFGFVSSPDGATVTIENIGLKDNLILIPFSAGFSFHGGLVGYIGSDSSIEITNSYTTGNILSSFNTTTLLGGGIMQIGGLVGGSTGSDSSIEITNSYTTGNISFSAPKHWGLVGGLVGYSSNTVSIANSYATGDVSLSIGRHAWAGGLVGVGYGGNITNSYATGDVSSSSTDNSSRSGGLVGHGYGTITNSYATGDVSSFSSSASSSDSSSDSNAGGLVGLSSSTLSIVNSYATGDVSSDHTYANLSHSGGLVGEVSSSITISNSYFVDSDGASTNGIGSTGVDVTPTIIGDVSQKTFKELVFDMVETKTLASEGQSWSSTDDGLAWSSTHWDTTGYGLPCLKNMPNNPLQDCGFTGVGTSAEPYIIKVYEQLKNMKYFLNSSYKLANNINAIRSRKEGAIGCTPYDPSDPKLDPSHANFDIEKLPENLCTGWEPIGNCGTDTICKDNRYTPLDESQDNNLFTGTFDGNGYSIKNLFSYSGSRNSGDVYAGFFGYVSSTNNTTLSIKDIGLKDNFILGVVSSSAVWVGGLVGYATSSGSIEITNSYTTGAVFSSSADGSHHDAIAGGLVGYATSSGPIKITNSYATGRISSSADNTAWAGGLVGHSGGSSSLSIANSYATGYISTSAKDWSLSGGLVGRGDSIEITNSYATGNIDAETSGSGYGSFSGGLVGSSNSTEITNSYATGDVSSSHQDASRKAAGGIVGIINSSVTISNSYFVDSDGASTHGIGSTDASVTPTITNVHQATGTDDASRLTWMKDTLDETDNDGLNWDNVLDSDGNVIDPQPWGNLNAIGFPCLRNMPSGAPSCP